MSRDLEELVAAAKATYATALAHAKRLQEGGEIGTQDRASVIAALRADMMVAAASVEDLLQYRLETASAEMDAQRRLSELEVILTVMLRADGGLGEINPAQAARHAEWEEERKAKNRADRARRKANRAEWDARDAAAASDGTTSEATPVLRSLRDGGAAS